MYKIIEELFSIGYNINKENRSGYLNK